MFRTISAIFFISLLAACSGGATTESTMAGGGGTGGSGGSGGSGGATGSASLNWNAPLENNDGTTLQNLSAYRIYQGTSTSRSSFELIATIDNPSVSVFLVENLAVGNYYFAVTAINSDDAESSFSNLAPVTIQ